MTDMTATMETTMTTTTAAGDAMDVDVATRTMVGDAMEVDAAAATTDCGRRGPTDIGTEGEDGGRYAGTMAGDGMDIDAATETTDYGRREVTAARPRRRAGRQTGLSQRARQRAKAREQHTAGMGRPAPSAS